MRDLNAALEGMNEKLTARNEQLRAAGEVAVDHYEAARELQL